MGLQVPDDFEPWDDSEKLQRVFSEAATRIMRLNGERATAIVAGANLEESLGELLSQFMVEGQRVWTPSYPLWGRVVADIPAFNRELVAALAQG